MPQSARIAEARETLRATLAGRAPADIDAYMERHYDHYWLRAEAELQIEHARMIREADRKGDSFAGASSASRRSSTSPKCRSTHPIIRGCCR